MDHASTIKHLSTYLRHYVLRTVSQLFEKCCMKCVEMCSIAAVLYCSPFAIWYQISPRCLGTAWWWSTQTINRMGYHDKIRAWCPQYLSQACYPSPGALLLLWINFNTALINNNIHHIKCGMKLLMHYPTSTTVPCGMDKSSHPMLYWTCDYLSMRDVPPLTAAVHFEHT